MKLKIIISFFVGGVIGILGCHAWTSLVSPNVSSATHHWRAIELYNAHIRDPSNAKLDPQMDLYYVEPLDDIEPHLAALVAAGELRHLDIVLPTVPCANRAATRHWMDFCERHAKDIVYVTGNPSYTAFPIKGPQPLHLNIWYRDTAKTVVQQLITELEDLGAREEAKDSSKGDSGS